LLRPLCIADRMMTGNAVEYFKALKRARLRGAAGVEEVEVGATKMDG
jgi:hypothetical protein